MQQSHSELGVYHEDLKKDYLTALCYYKKTKKQYQDLKSTQHEFIATVNIIHSLLALGQYDEIGVYLRQMENLSQQFSIVETIWYLYSLFRLEIARKTYHKIILSLNQVQKIAISEVGGEELRNSILKIYFYFAESYYQLSEFKEGITWNKQVLKRWNEYQLKNKETFHCQILLQQLLLQFCFGNYTNGINATIALLEQFLENEQQAHTHYQLWQMHSNQILLDESADKALLETILSPEKAAYYKAQALDFYQKTYEKNPHYDFKLKIDELM